MSGFTFTLVPGTGCVTYTRSKDNVPPNTFDCSPGLAFDVETCSCELTNGVECSVYIEIGSSDHFITCYLSFFSVPMYPVNECQTAKLLKIGNAYGIFYDIHLKFGRY